MFWFLVAIILFIMVMKLRDDVQKASKTGYERGVVAGRQALTQEIEALRRNGAVPEKKLAALLKTDVSTPAVTLETPAPVWQETGLMQIDDEPETTAPEPQTLAPAPQLAPPTEAELAEEKSRRTIRNLNIMLYVGSFLIVAATALFVNLTMPEAVRLGSMLLVTMAFYVAGLVLHERSERLRSAAVAFTGTGLAIVPFLGFAFHMLGGVSPEIAWLLTSLLGLVMYGVAAVRLQSEFISYAMMAFVLSLALSAVSTLGLAVLWYFVAVIAVSLVCNLLRVLYPKVLPKSFQKPLKDTGRIVVPVALVGSLLAADSMEIWMYEILFGVATAHYMVTWLLTHRWKDELAARILAHITLLIVLADVTQAMASEHTAIVQNIGWIVLAGAQLAYSLVRVNLKNKRSVKREKTIASVALGLLVLAIFMWAGTAHDAAWAAGTIALVALACGSISYKFRQIGWLYGVVASVIILPFLIGREVFSPALSFATIGVFFAALSMLLLPIIEQSIANKQLKPLQQLLQIAAVVSTFALLACGLFEQDVATIGWTFLVAAGALIGLALITKRAAYEGIGAVLGVVSIGAWLDVALVNKDWWWLLTMVLGTVALLAGAALHQQHKQRDNRDILAAIAAVVLAGSVFAFGVSTEVTRTVALLLLAASVAAVVVRYVLGERAKRLGMAAMGAYFIYPVLVFFGALDLPEGPALALFVAAGIMVASSYIEKQPLVMIYANVLFVGALSALWAWLEFSSYWAVHGVTWLAAAVFYGLYWYMRSNKDELRERVCFWSVALLLGVASLYAIGSATVATPLVLASAGSLLALAFVVGVHGYLQKKRTIVEGAVYGGTVALQWMTTVLLPEVNVVVYAHWWALTIAAVALWRKEYARRLMVALAFVTGSTGIYALAGEPGYALIFLIEHLALIVAAGLLRAQWGLWWGIIAVVVAVLYFLRSYTVVILLFLGFLLILFVVWRLLKINKK